MASSSTASIGPHGFWGYSSGFNWLECFPKFDEQESPISILLMSPGDIRHVLAAVSRRKRSSNKNSQKPLHFYIFDTPIEVLARHIFLLEVLNDYEVPIRQRAAVFLEIFGNCKVQDRTARYIEQISHQLRALITKGIGRLQNILDLTLLRYRERDDLELVFKNYGLNNPFDMDTLRDHRLRGYFAERYDNRQALADYDYYYSLKETASIIHPKLFKDWRMTGIAFEFGNQVYSEPNRTMISYTEGVMKRGKDKGLKKEVKGFWGDVVASPYFSFGIDCDTPNSFSEGLFQIINKGTGTEQHRHHTVEVAMYNLFSYLWEIETGNVYKMTKANDIYSGLGLESGINDANKDEENGEILCASATEEVQGSEDENNPKCEIPIDSSATMEENRTEKLGDAIDCDSNSEIDEEVLAKAFMRAECILESWKGVKIFMMTGDALALLSKPKFRGKFHGSFFSCRMAHVASSPVMNEILVDGAVVAIETTKFMVHMPQKGKLEYVSKISEIVSQQPWDKIEQAPVFRRRRDEKDGTDDVIFYKKKY